MIDKRIKTIGRYAIKNDRYLFFNGGSGFSFKMKGESFHLDFNSKPVDGYYYIIIDKDYSSKIRISTLNKEEYHFKNNGEHYVDVVKANETNNNVFELVKLEINGELLNNDHVYLKRAIVYGDSTVAGFGILSHDGQASIHNCDAVRDFCFHALYDLNYEIDIFSASGWGLAFSAYTCPKNIGILDYHNKVGVYQSLDWKDEKKADLLIISLGTNDNAYIQENIEHKEDLTKEFIVKYKSLIDESIHNNKEIKILMVYGTLNEQNAYWLIEKTYEVLKPQYQNLFIHKFNGDNTAISNHAYVDAHDLMAEELKKVIAKIM